MPPGPNAFGWDTGTVGKKSPNLKISRVSSNARYGKRSKRMMYQLPICHNDAA